MLVYIAETWLLLAANVRSLIAFYPKCLRQLLGICWHITTKYCNRLARLHCRLFFVFFFLMHLYLRVCDTPSNIENLSLLILFRHRCTLVLVSSFLLMATPISLLFPGWKLICTTWISSIWTSERSTPSTDFTMPTSRSWTCQSTFSRHRCSTTSVWERTWACRRPSYCWTTQTQSSRCPLR